MPPIIIPIHDENSAEVTLGRVIELTDDGLEQVESNSTKIYLSGKERALYAMVDEFAIEEETQMIVSFDQDIPIDNIHLYLDGHGNVVLEFVDYKGNEQIHILEKGER